MKLRNTKHEKRNKLEITKNENSNNKKYDLEVWRIVILNLWFVSDFVFRISDL